MAGNINPAEIQDYYSETQSLRHERSTPSVKDNFLLYPIWYSTPRQLLAHLFSVWSS